LANLAVAQLALGLALKLRLHQLDRHDGRQPLADVIAGQVAVVRLQHAALAAVIVDDAGQRRAEACQVRAALGRVDVVGEGEDALVEAVVPLQRDFDGGGVLEPLDVQRRAEQRLLVLVQVLDKGHDAALIVVGLLLGGLGAKVYELDFDALVEERHLAKARAQRVKVEVAGLEDAGLRLRAGLHVRPEADGGTGAVGLADDLQVVERLSALILLLVDLAVLIHVDLKVAGQRVDHRRAHAVQAAGDLVAAASEFAAGVQHRQAHLDSGSPHLGVNAHREAAAVVLDGNGAVFVERDDDVIAEAGQRLVHRVVDDFVHQVVQPALICGADIHAGPAAHRLQAFQHLNVVFVVVSAIGFNGHPGTS